MPRNMDPAAIQQEITDAANASDQARRAGLGHARDIIAARQATIALAQGRAAAKYGDRAPQTLAWARRAQVAADEVVGARAQLDRANLDPVVVPPGSALVYGRVIDGDANPIAGVIVSATNDAGAEIGSTTTDLRGSFSLGFQADPANNNAPPGPIRLRLIQNNQVVLQDDQTLTLAVGRAAYRELVLATTPGPGPQPSPRPIRGGPPTPARGGGPPVP